MEYERIPTPLFDSIVVTSWSTLGSSFPVPLTFIVTSLQHCDLDSFSRLLLLDTITGMSTTLSHELDLWNLLHDLTLSRHGYQVGSSCFDLQQLDGVMTGHHLLCSDPVTFHVSLLCFGAFDLHLLDESGAQEFHIRSRFTSRVDVHILVQELHLWELSTVVCTDCTASM